MEIGIGLPSTIPGTRPDQIIEWARAAEECGFSSIAVIDRLVYGSAEPLVTLGAVAAVPATAARLAATALTSATVVRETVTAYERAGCDELVLFPCDPDPRQVRLLAEVAL
jgi:hypothetical protein